MPMVDSLILELEARQEEAIRQLIELEARIEAALKAAQPAVGLLLQQPETMPPHGDTPDQRAAA